MDISNYKKRRQQLAKKMKNGIAVIPSGRMCKYGLDRSCRFQPQSSFLYLSGYLEPEALLVISVQNSIIVDSSIFCLPKDSSAELWVGKRVGPKNASKILGLSSGYPIKDFPTVFAKMASDHTVLFHAFGVDSELDQHITTWAKSRQAHSAPIDGIADWTSIVDALRAKKSDEEIKIIKASSRIAEEAHKEVMITVKNLAWEYQAEALLTKHYRYNGCHHAFSPIVASGPNACTLHYGKNDAPIQRNKLILIDSGCKFNGYCSDITRTIPSSGKFTSAQKDIYQIVLEAQKAALQQVKPGSSWNKAHKAAVQKIAVGLRDLKICKGTLDTITHKGHKRFFPHKIGHWLGLDVHDTSTAYYHMSGEPQSFLSSMTLTIEPGLYIPKDPDIPKEYRGIGIRIEDDVLITSHGNSILTKNIPNSISDIEGLMA